MPKNLEQYQKLVVSLESLVRIYRSLLAVVRKEKTILIASDLDELSENNKSKEAMVIKIRSIELERIENTKRLAESEGLNPETIKLLDFAVHYSGEHGEKLRSLHSVLRLLIKRVQEHNIENEKLVKSALDHISGAMKSIRSTISEKPTYAQRGEVQESKTQSGQLVSREV